MFFLYITISYLVYKMLDVFVAEDLLKHLY